MDKIKLLAIIAELEIKLAELKAEAELDTVV